MSEVTNNDVKVALTGYYIYPRDDFIEYRHILLVGPTGSGKSSFIEALAGPQVSLGIAKNQLDGFTQKISTFRVTIPGFRKPIFLVDCPGFADSKISEYQILGDISTFMGSSKYFNRIFYFTPITDTRVPASKRNVISMLHQLTGDRYDRIRVVTTMWDTLCNESMRNRANRNFEELRDDVWKDSRLVSKFYNTQASSRSILQEALSDTDILIPFQVQSWPWSFRLPKYVYDNLLERIAMAQQDIQLSNDELSHQEAQSNEHLRSILIAKRTEAGENLKRYAQQLVDFGPPPPGSSLCVFPRDLLTFRQYIKQGWRVKKRDIFGTKNRPT